MGKASRWFRSLFASKKSPAEDKKKNGKWAPSSSGDGSVAFKNRAEENPLASPYSDGGLDANKHAIAVAAATAAVAEAALAAAHAAAEVVRLTSGVGSGRGGSYVGGERRAVFAAVKIQSAFRAYLARRALRALKGLVKLQALWRGHIVRKQSADMLRRMQVMARIQAQASGCRSDSSNTKIKNHLGITNLRIYEERSNSANHGGPLLKQNHSRSHIGNNSMNKEIPHLTSRWLNHCMEQSTWNNNHLHGDDERSDKILEIDTWRPRHNATRNVRNAPTSQYFSAWNDPKTGPFSGLSSRLQKPNPSISSEDISSPVIISPKFHPDNSPGMHSVSSSRPFNNPRGPFTPARSECSRSLFGDYIGHPSYMANTESSRAKVRSHSAPKQRMQFEENFSKFGRDIWESDTISEKGSAIMANYRGRNYPHSGQVKRQGTPTRFNEAFGFSSIYGHRL